MDSNTTSSKREHLISLAAFMAELFGWKKRYDLTPACWEQPNGDLYYEGDTSNPPPISIDEAWVFPMREWLNSKGFTVDMRQDFLDDQFGADDNEPLRWIVNVQAHIKLLRRAGHPNIHKPGLFTIYNRTGDTLPETLCLIIRALVEKFPDLRDPVTKEDTEVSA